MSLTILSIAYPFAPVGPDTAGGAEQILYQIDRELCTMGHHSIVVACEGSQVFGQLVASPRPEATLGPELCQSLHAEHSRRIQWVLNNYNIDLIHMHGIDFDRYLPPAGKPVLVTLHLPPEWYPALTPNRPNTWFNCVSNSQRRRCPSMPPLLPDVENGVPVGRFDWQRPKERFALAMGRICPEKNFHAAMDAARMAKTPLFLAGEVFRHEAHQTYFHKEIQPRFGAFCQFLGPLRFGRKRNVLSRARCLLQPSLCAETSSLVAMEALASGTPVIAYPSGALPEIVEHGVTGFIVRDTAEMAEAIQEVDGICPEACRRAAQSRFSSTRMAKDYLRLYTAVLDGSAEKPSFDRKFAQVPFRAQSG